VQGTQKLCFGIATCLVAATGAASTATGESPLWEAGVGLAAVSLPAYRGADESGGYVLPLPYFTYRGHFLSADRDGVRGHLLESERLRLDVSLAVSPPVSSRSVKVREGMPGLKPTFEFGPRLQISLFRSEGPLRHVKFELPIRAAFTLEPASRSVGFVLHPKLGVDLADLPGLRGWRLGLNGGPLFGDRRQHDYYYGVSAAEVIPGRNAYNPGAGYSGMQFTASLSRRFPAYWVGGFARFDTVNGAVFAASPLVRRDSSLALGFGVAWILGASRQAAAGDD
jgi:outer membrane scaffolding protein for murein synthesis (MipA/OmpV family)